VVAAVTIPGLRYLPGYLDAAQHDGLLAAVDAGPWRGFGDRRAQIYGYSYHYTKGVYRVEDLPAWAQDLAARLESDGLMPDIADQMIVNDYAPGQGIPAHVDAPLFTDTIVSISLVSGCVMEFTNARSGALARLRLDAMSALVIAGEARHDWKHSIPACAFDACMEQELPRGRRVSLTLRKMLPLAERPAWSPPGIGRFSNG
jgi:alkylated DNA repair dioxygenase AlkB